MKLPAAKSVIRKAIPIAWATSVVAGLVVLIDYSSAPGDLPHANAGQISAETTAIPLASDRPTAVMFLHPRCPCSVSSVREFGRLLGRANIETAVRFVIYEPQECEPDWCETRLVSMATELAGGMDNLVFDRGGETARQFDVKVSGHLMVFSADGSCRYSGGTTMSRGHEGDNTGASLALSALTDSAVTGASKELMECSPVYGCQLFTQEAKDAE